MQLLRMYVVLAAILLFASGCATGGSEMTGGNFCDVYEPHSLPVQALKLMTSRQIDAWEDNLIAYEILCLASR